MRLYETALERLSRVPGVRSEAFSSEALFGGGTWTEPVSAPGFMPRPGEDRDSVLLMISPGFFRTMETAMLRGRDFTLRDDEGAPKVAIVNEAMARFYFGGTDVVGRTFRVEHHSFPQPLTVVGVVRDARYRSLREPAPRIVYLPDLQNPGPFGGANIRSANGCRSRKDGGSVVEGRAGRESISQVLGHDDAGAPGRRDDRARPDAGATPGLLRPCGSRAGLSGAVRPDGLRSVAAHRRDRRADRAGAQRRDVIRMVLGGTMAPVAGGVVLGLCAAVGLARLVESLLFGAHGIDGVTLLAVVAMVLGVGAAAAWWPARRAARVDPIASLRYE